MIKNKHYFSNYYENMDIKCTFALTICLMFFFIKVTIAPYLFMFRPNIRFNEFIEVHPEINSIYDWQFSQIRIGMKIYFISFCFDILMIIALFIIVKQIGTMYRRIEQLEHDQFMINV